MEKYSRIVAVSGRSFRTSETMCDIFLAHVSDIRARRLTELVPLLHEGGVDMLLVSETTPIEVTEVGSIVVPDFAPAVAITTAA